jgi:hypothetical protein
MLSYPRNRRWRPIGLGDVRDATLSGPVFPNLWYANPWGYAAYRLRVRENNIGNGGKQKKKS